MPEWVLPSLVSGLLAVMATLLAVLVQNRRSLLTYHVTHERIGISAIDDVHGEVAVTVGGNQMQNLYLSNVWLVNRSMRDVEDLDVKIYSGNNDTHLMSEQTNIEGTVDTLEHTTQYQEIVNRLIESLGKIKAAKATGDDATVSAIYSSQAANWRIYRTQRWYEVPVLARGQTIRATYLTNVLTNTDPIIHVSCQKAGVRLKYKQPYQPIWHIFGVPLLEASVCGILIGAVICLIVINTVTTIWLAVVLCFIAGALGNVPGAGLLKLYRWVLGHLVG